MFKHYLGLIENVAIWPIISLAIFFAFFVSLLIWVFSANQNTLHNISLMPLDEDSATAQNLRENDKKKN